MSEDPLSFEAGDINLYRYVRNNPISFSDPSGLILQWGCDNSKLGLEDHLRIIKSTSKGKELVELLEKSKTVYKIHMRLRGPSEQIGNEVFINPNENRSIETTDGRRTASIARVLAHELGHLAGAADDANNTNVIKWENPVMTDVDKLIRTDY